MTARVTTADRWRRAGAMGAGIVCAMTGLLVLAGWNLQIPKLIRIFPRFGTMQPNAALGCIVCGAGLMAFQRSRRRLGGTLGCIAGLLGILTLAEHVFRLDLHIDTLLVRSWPSRDGIPLGRMSAAAAVCFVLAGAALATLSRSATTQRDRLVVELLSAFVAAFGLAGVVSFAFHPDTPYKWHSLTGMALRTCASFLLLGLGLLVVAGQHCSMGRDWRRAHLWLPFLVALGIATTSWVLWGGMISTEKAWSAHRVETEAPFVREQIVGDARTLASRLRKIAGCLTSHGSPWEEHYLLELQAHGELPASLKGVGWADNSSNIQWIVPRDGNEALTGQTLLEEGLFPNGIQITSSSSPLFVSRSLDPGSAAKAFLLTVPILKGENLDGFLLGVVDLKQFFDTALPEKVAQGCTISIYDGKAEVYRRPGGRTKEGTDGARASPTSVYELWSCRIGVDGSADVFAGSLFPGAVIAAGHVLAVLLALTVAFAQTARRRTAALLDANQKLEGEITERLRAEESLLTARDELETRVLERTAELSSANAELKSEVVERQRVEKEREALLVELEAEKVRLAAADRRKTEFLAILGHELRNPLSPILNTLEVMRRRGNGSAWKDGEREILERQVRQLARLVDDLLDLSRITRGQIALHKERVDLSSVIQSAADALRSVVENRGIELDVDLPAEPLEAIADPARIEQTLNNLLHNAAKFTDAGGRISIHAARDGGEAVVSIRDTGAGLEPEAIQRIFEPFTQANKAKMKSRSGLGIGLTLVKSFVELHGGSVAAKSCGSGKGSEFQVRLPLLAPAMESRTAGRLPESASASTAERTSRRVFVVDDNVDSAKTLQVLIKLWGHEAEVAYDGETALRAIPPYDPSLVILDLELPGMSGYEVAKRLRKDGLADLKIVALTGYGQDEDRRRTTDAGIDVHLVKPVEPAVLERMLAEER